MLRIKFLHGLATAGVPLQADVNRLARMRRANSI
jgi:hypothetical protein